MRNQKMTRPVSDCISTEECDAITDWLGHFLKPTRWRAVQYIFDSSMHFTNNILQFFFMLLFYIRLRHPVQSRAEPGPRGGQSESGDTVFQFHWSFIQCCWHSQDDKWGNRVFLAVGRQRTLALDKVSTPGQERHQHSNLKYARPHFSHADHTLGWFLYSFYRGYG